DRSHAFQLRPATPPPSSPAASPSGENDDGGALQSPDQRTNSSPETPIATPRNAPTTATSAPTRPASQRTRRRGINRAHAAASLAQDDRASAYATPREIPSLDPCHPSLPAPRSCS